MSDDRPEFNVGYVLAYAITFPFAMIGYKMTEGGLSDLGWSRWPTIGIASLGGLVGATLGVAIAFKLILPLTQRRK